MENAILKLEAGNQVLRNDIKTLGDQKSRAEAFYQQILQQEDELQFKQREIHELQMELSMMHDTLAGRQEDAEQDQEALVALQARLQELTPWPDRGFQADMAPTSAQTASYFKVEESVVEVSHMNVTLEQELSAATENSRGAIHSPGEFWHISIMCSKLPVDQYVQYESPTKMYSQSGGSPVTPEVEKNINWPATVPLNIVLRTGTLIMISSDGLLTP